MIKIDVKKFDSIFHSPVRMAILSILVSNIEADFLYLKKSTDTTDGNLSTHINRLEKGGFITTTKKFIKKKPKTICRITKQGKRAFYQYIQALENIINIAKSKKPIK